MPAFDWDDANLAHIGRHAVSATEAEEAARSETLSVDVYPVDGEVRYEEIGITANGRILRFITTERDHKVRIVTAFDASPAERKLYRNSW